jgi:Putative cyclase
MPDLKLPAYDELPKTKDNIRSGWGVFGADDNLGLMNLLTPERIAAAAKLVKRGAVFSLNAPLDAVAPAMFSRGTPRHTVITVAKGRSTDDVIDNLYPQASSQWDSLAHVSFDFKQFYNGASLDDVTSGRRNTIDHWARRGIAGRAVLLDLQRSQAQTGDAYNPGTSRAFTVEELERARKRAGITFQPGDLILLHTGYFKWYLAQDTATRVALAPRESLKTCGVEHTEAMARYLWNTHACALIGDNAAIEVWPPDHSKEAWPFGFMHHMLIGQFGVALGELWWLHDLAADCAADNVSEMLLTSAPLNMPGGIGSPANALAIK